MKQCQVHGKCSVNDSSPLPTPLPPSSSLSSDNSSSSNNRSSKVNAIISLLSVELAVGENSPGRLTHIIRKKIWSQATYLKRGREIIKEDGLLNIGSASLAR